MASFNLPLLAAWNLNVDERSSHLVTYWGIDTPSFHQSITNTATKAIVVTIIKVKKRAV